MSGGVRDRNVLFVKAAIWCGAIPLLVGTLIYGTWRFTRWDWLEKVGLFTIPVGCVIFVAGTVALLRYIWRARRAGHHSPGLLWAQGLLVGGLLLSNFPMAAFYTLSAIDVATRYTVRVHNDTDRPVESLVVTGPGVHAELGPIAPGQWVRRHFHFRGDGPLEFSARQQDSRSTGQLEGYVTGGLGGDKSIRIGLGGEYEIQSKAR